MIKYSSKYLLSAFLWIVQLGCTHSTIQTPSETTSSPKKSLPLILGHRGACGLRPEHTLASYELAIEMGADYIEPDLVSTKDGVLIVRHENEISQTTNVAQRFPTRKKIKFIDGHKIEGWFTEDFKLSEIRELKSKERLASRNQSFNNQFSVPTFEEVIQLVQKKEKELGRTIGLIPEIKHSTYFKSKGLAIEPKLLSLLNKYGYNRKDSPLIIQSFEISTLQELHKKTPYKLLQLIDQPQKQPADQIGRSALTYQEMITSEGLQRIATYAQVLGPSKSLIVPQNLDKTLTAPTSLIEEAHEAGLLVMPYTFRNDKEFLSPDYNEDPIKEYHQFFSLGVDGLFTDFTATAVKARATWNP